MNGVSLSFTTSGFVDSDESRADRINDNIGGHALAFWLSDNLRKTGVTVSEPWAEDHGWDFDIRDGERIYLCGCSIEDEGSVPHTGHVVLELSRSFLDRLRGRNVFIASDPIARSIEQTLAQSEEITGLETN